MRFLLDMPVPPALGDWLIARGHDSVHASHMGLDRALDRHLLDVALQEERVVITADTDFPQLLALSGDASPGVILFRSGDFSTGELIDLLARVLNAIPEAALAHSVCVVDRQRIRCRPLPLR